MPPTFDSRDRIGQVDLEKKFQELIYLFLKEYFTGAVHNLNPEDPEMTALYFPQVEFGINVTPLKQLGLPLLQIVFESLRPTSSDGCPKGGTDEEILVREREATIVHYIRVAHKGSDDKDSEFAARSVADRLRLVYEQAPRGKLAGKGIHHPKVTRLPEPLAAPKFSIRQMVVTATLRYEVHR